MRELRVIDAEEVAALSENFAWQNHQSETTLSLLHTVTTQADQIAAALALHQPRRDGSWSLVADAHCTCGASEIRTMEDGYASIVPARYPCPTARALGVTA